jgi:hypothetical protein
MQVLLTQKILTTCQKWGWDPEKTYPGSETRDQKSTASRIRSEKPSDLGKKYKTISKLNRN